MRQPGTVEILSGLAEGEKIVTHGTMTARPGQTANITAEEKGGESLSDILINNPKKETPAQKGKAE